MHSSFVLEVARVHVAVREREGAVLAGRVLCRESLQQRRGISHLALSHQLRDGSDLGVVLDTGQRGSGARLQLLVRSRRSRKQWSGSDRSGRRCCRSSSSWR